MLNILTKKSKTNNKQNKQTKKPPKNHERTPESFGGDG